MTPLDDLPILPALIAERLTVPRAIALAERRDGQTVALGSEDVHRRAAAVAHALRAARIGRGDRVAIIAKNRIEWLLADFGILYAGAVVVPVFATTAGDQLRYILTDSEAKLIFTDDAGTAAAIRLAAPDAPPIVIFEGEGPATFAAFVAAGEALRDAAPGEVERFREGIGLDDLAVLIYTSGTTGTPKGVMLSHRNLASNVVDAYDPAVSDLHAGEVALSVLPFAHIYEHTNALGYLYNRASHYVTTPEHLMDDLRVLHPSHIAFVPRIFERLLAAIIAKARAAGGLRAKLVPWALEVGTAYERARRDAPPPSLGLRVRYAIARALVLRKIKPTLGLERLDYFVSGSAPLHRDVALTLAAMGIEVMEGYGLTETAPVVTVNRPADNRLGTVGMPIRNVQVRIAEDGEVLVKGPNVMLGYYHVPPEEQPFTADGWFQTGDIGRMEDGRLQITDRKRELFKSTGGKWVSPARIETALKRSIYLAQVVAYGDHRPHPCVLVAPNWSLLRAELGLPEEMPTEALARNQEVRAIVIREVEAQTADLAAFEQVRRVALLPRDLTIEEGELSPTLKVKRRVVEERYAALIAQAYAEDLHARTPAAT